MKYNMVSMFLLLLFLFFIFNPGVPMEQKQATIQFGLTTTVLHLTPGLFFLASSSTSHSLLQV